MSQHVTGEVGSCWLGLLRHVCAAAQISVAEASGQWQPVPIASVVVRECREVSELEDLYLAIGRQFGDSWDVSDRRLDEPRLRFENDRQLMLALWDGTSVRGGVIAFGEDVVTVRAIGIDVELRGHGHGRRLLELIEARALVRGSRRIALGAAEQARGFYERMGYRGKHAMRSKELPPMGAVRSRLVARAAAQLEQLSSGLPVP